MNELCDSLSKIKEIILGVSRNKLSLLMLWHIPRISESIYFGFRRLWLLTPNLNVNPPAPPQAQTA